jgi:transcriptional regulator with XRE-family HTH domain
MRGEDETHGARLGAAVRQLRRARGWSQAALAEKLELSTDYVSLLERGLRLPALPVLLAMADVLGADLDGLVGRNQRAPAWMEQAVALLRAVPVDARPAVLAMLRGVAASARR